LRAIHEALAELDLQLPAGRRLEPRPRQGLGFERWPIRGDRTLQRAQADGQSLLGHQVLPHNIGIAPVADKPLAQPVFVPIERLRPLASLERLPVSRRTDTRP
jgi:hypothetical protein